MRKKLEMLQIGCCVFSVLALLSAGQAFAQEKSQPTDDKAIGSGINCADPTVDFTDSSSLTPAERLALMDVALQRSLSKFDACQTDQSGKNAANAGGGGGGSSGGGGGSDADGGGNGNAGGGNSVAATDMSGTETPAASNEEMSSGASGWTRPDQARRSDDTPTDTTTQAPGTQALNNGKVPEDIPPADNDSVLEAQIRKAAINETDPEVKKKLWDEYRKYKGLPKVDHD